MKTIELRIPKISPKTFAVKSNLTKERLYFSTFLYHKQNKKIIFLRIFEYIKTLLIKSLNRYISNKTKDIPITGDKNSCHNRNFNILIQA